MPLRLDRGEDALAQPRVGHQLGVARGQRQVALGQHHVHVRQQGAEERPLPVHLLQQGQALRAGRCSDCRSRNSCTAVPKPYQPGKVRRHWPQLKLQGMARRSSMRCDGLARRRPRADVEFGDLADRRGAEEVIGEARASRRPARGRPPCWPAKGVRAATQERLGRCLGRLQQGGFQRRRDQRFQVAPADLGVGVFGADHFALFGQPDLAAHGAGRLRQDGLVARAAAAAHGAAAAMEHAQLDVVRVGELRRTSPPARSRRGTAPSCW